MVYILTSKQTWSKLVSGEKARHLSARDKGQYNHRPYKGKGGVTTVFIFTLRANCWRLAKPTQ